MLCSGYLAAKCIILYKLMSWKIYCNVFFSVVEGGSYKFLVLWDEQINSFENTISRLRSLYDGFT